MSKSSVKNIEVLYEDNHLIAINKKAGDIIQGDKTGDTPLSEIVKEYLKVKYNKPGNVFVGVTHRIDRPTTGIILFAKTSKALERMNKMFKDKTIHKYYWALVEGKAPKKQHLVHFLKKNGKTNKSQAYEKEIQDSKKAILSFNTLFNLEKYTLLQVDLETGRHHQIRCQLSKIGFPIKGDVKYGAKRANTDLSINLHARHIKFVHPVKKVEISISAPLPEEKTWTIVKNNYEVR